MDQFAISIFYMNETTQRKVKLLAMDTVKVNGRVGISLNALSAQFASFSHFHAADHRRELCISSL